VDVPHVVASDGVEVLDITEDAYAGKPNPHAWMSPVNVRAYVDNGKDPGVCCGERLGNSAPQPSAGTNDEGCPAGDSAWCSFHSSAQGRDRAARVRHQRVASV